MQSLKDFEAALVDLSFDEERFSKAIDKYLGLCLRVIKDLKEFREELEDIDEIYWICLTDINFSLWLKVSKGIVEYGIGKPEKAQFECEMTKKVLIKIMTRQISGLDAFMRGVIKTKGNLSQGIRFIKLFRLFHQYVNALYEAQMHK